MKSLLRKNPELVTKYVNACIYLLNKLLMPITAFMRHLLSVQNIDLKTMSNSEFKVALNNVFDHLHNNADNTTSQKYIKNYEKTKNIPSFKNIEELTNPSIKDKEIINKRSRNKIKLKKPITRAIRLKKPTTRKINVK